MQPENTTPAQPPKVLLIEDNDIDVELVKRIAARYPLDITIVRAANGIEALDILNQPDQRGLAHPYIVLMDNNMPMMNGIELLEHIASQGREIDVPLYILSTSDSVIDRRKFSQYKVTDYLVKPLTKQVFADIVEPA